MAKEKEKLFMAAMKKKFKEAPTEVNTNYYSFGGWKSSLFGDTHAHGTEGVHFFTRGKVVTSRWLDPSHGGINLGSPQWRADVNGVANDDHGTSGKLYLGYQLGPVLSVEGGYLDLGKISDPLGQARARGLFVDAVGTWPIAPQWSVIGRAGLAHGDIKTSTGDDTSLGLRAGLGLQYDLNPSVALRGELERNRFTDVFGQGLSADQVTLGVKMKF